MVTTRVRIWVNTHRCIGVLSTFRPLILRLLFIFNFSFLIINCGLDVEDATSPSAPVWVQKSLPEEWPERGVDAHETGGIILEWEGNESQDLVAYLIYRATCFEVPDSIGEFALQVRLKTNELVTFEYLDVGQSNGIGYAYVIHAEDVSGNVSDRSDTVSYTLISAVDALTMRPNGQLTHLGEDRLLRWEYIINIEMEDYHLTILDDELRVLSRVRLLPSSYVGYYESYYIPVTVSLRRGAIHHWRIDTAAKYINGRESVGSESRWASFVF